MGINWYELKAVYRRLSRGCYAGVRESVFDELTINRDKRYDSTIVRVHQQSSEWKRDCVKSGVGAFVTRIDHTNP